MSTISRILICVLFNTKCNEIMLEYIGNESGTQAYNTLLRHWHHFFPRSSTGLWLSTWFYNGPTEAKVHWIQSALQRPTSESVLVPCIKGCNTCMVPNNLVDLKFLPMGRHKQHHKQSHNDNYLSYLVWDWLTPQQHITTVQPLIFMYVNVCAFMFVLHMCVGTQGE